MIPLEFVKGILTEFKKYKISSKALDFVFFVIPQVIVVVVVLRYIFPFSKISGSHNLSKCYTSNNIKLSDGSRIRRKMIHL